MSSRFPIGVETIYKPFFKVFILSISIFILSCAPVNNSSKNIKVSNYQEINKITNTKKIIKLNKIEPSDPKKNLNNNLLLSSIELIMPSDSNIEITENLINSFELSVYKKNIKNVKININKYPNLSELEILLKKKVEPGKIFIGTLNSEATKVVKNYCDQGIIFFSFAANKNLAEECVYLINFFPEDDLIALFDYFPSESKIALLFPENYYGYNINRIIDLIAAKSKSLIVNRASYSEDLTNARSAIKELGKYELRKYELERQKKILEKKDDEISKRALKKIIKFETIGGVEFTHLILPDYSIRLLEIAPLLPFYDVDPNKVQFVGTGVWDDSIFFDEPSLQGAIFSGIEQSKRVNFFDDYYTIYKKKPIRTSTIPYDLTALLSYFISREMTLGEVYNFMNNDKIKLDGIDGRFFFLNNIIFRELDILKISNGEARKIN
jgi:hypothetical protein